MTLTSTEITMPERLLEQVQRRADRVAERRRDPAQIRRMLDALSSGHNAGHDSRGRLHVSVVLLKDLQHTLRDDVLAPMYWSEARDVPAGNRDRDLVRLARTLEVPGVE